MQSDAVGRSKVVAEHDDQHEGSHGMERLAAKMRCTGETQSDFLDRKSKRMVRYNIYLNVVMAAPLMVCYSPVPMLVDSITTFKKMLQ